MLAVAHVITGEMFDGYTTVIFLHGFHVGLSHLEHFIGIIAKGTNVGDGVIGIELVMLHWAEAS